MGSRNKRIRTESRTPPALSDPAVSDGEGGCGGGAGPAERKRELERNRRNLVNVRFAELENQLAQLPGAPTRVNRRLDKEVVLKDAAQSLAAQQRDLDDAVRRIATMTAEIEILRSEKLELRHDKAYLHKEIESARAENKTLAADNMALWQALRKTGAVKLPLDVLLRPTQLLHTSSPEQTAAPDATTECTQSGSRGRDTTSAADLAAPKPGGRNVAAVCPCGAPQTACPRDTTSSMLKQARAEGAKGAVGEGGLLPQPVEESSDLFPNYPDPMDTAGAAAKQDGTAPVVGACDCLGTTGGAGNEEFLKIAQDYRLRGLNPSFMLQYGFEDPREMAQFQLGLDEVNQQNLPDIAPCG